MLTRLVLFWGHFKNLKQSNKGCHPRAPTQWQHMKTTKYSVSINNPFSQWAWNSQDAQRNMRVLDHEAWASHRTSLDLSFCFVLFLDFIYLFMRDTHKRERGRDTDRGRSRLHAGSPMGDLILGPGSPRSCPGLKAALNHWATRAAQNNKFLHEIYQLKKKKCSLFG